MSLNCQIWRATEEDWILLGLCMMEGGYLSISGVWGKTLKAPVKGEKAVFEDEANGRWHYYLDKGKNWAITKRLCPELAEFEFWDENKTRIGTYTQEKHLWDAGLFNASYVEKIASLEKAGLKEVPIDVEDGTLFDPKYKAEKYLYGSSILAIPLPNKIQSQIRKIAKQEEQ